MLTKSTGNPSPVVPNGTQTPMCKGWVESTRAGPALTDLLMRFAASWWLHPPPASSSSGLHPQVLAGGAVEACTGWPHTPSEALRGLHKLCRASANRCFSSCIVVQGVPLDAARLSLDVARWCSDSARCTTLDASGADRGRTQLQAETGRGSSHFCATPRSVRTFSNNRVLLLPKTASCIESPFAVCLDRVPEDIALRCFWSCT
mmetsp:Transcript_41130/g.94616  ORF Transcript_41130/g.94616 Transcript_41130/m.94616 type:complete len:204 (+) Transcript_41130:23-634(+)